MSTSRDATPPMHILAYSDGSAQSAEAVRSAVRLAKAAKGELDILVTMPASLADPAISYEANAPLPRSLWPKLPEDLRHFCLDILPWLAEEGYIALPQTVRYREATNGKRRFIADIEGEKTPPLRMWISYQNAEDAIADLTAEHEHDLVVVRGSSTGLLERLFGRNLSTSLALRLPTSMLVVRGPVRPDSRFVLCSDGSESSRRAFGIMRKIMPALKNPVDMLINEGQDPSELRQWLGSWKKEGKVMAIPGEDPSAEIIKTIHADEVLVVGASMRAYILRRFKGSVPVLLIRHAPFSVLLSKELPDRADQSAKNA